MSIILSSLRDLCALINLLFYYPAIPPGFFINITLCSLLCETFQKVPSCKKSTVKGPGISSRIGCGQWTVDC